MKVSQALAILAFATQLNAAAVPEAKNTFHILPIDDRAPDAAALVSPDHTLEKRKGGGGRGGGSSGSTGGGRSSGGSSSSPPARTLGNSNAGGSTSAGSGPARAFGGGSYYGGGARTPYKAGSSTPRGLFAGALIAPFVLLAIMPGIWLYSAYPYYYNNPYRFHNQSATDDDNDNDRRSLQTRQTTGRNETLPVMCLCQDFSACGCDENDDQQYLNDLIGNGSYAALNKTLVTVSDVNGTRTLVLNGTLPNGTTAPGGTDDEEGAAINLAMGKYTGYYAMALIVLYGVML